MSVFDFDVFYEHIIQLKSSKDVDKAFERVLALDPAAQRAVGKALEERFLSQMESVEDLIRKKGPHAVKKILSDDSVMTNSETGKRMSTQEVIAHAQALAQINSYIDILLPGKASPVTRAFNTTAASLRYRDRYSMDMFIQPMHAAIDALVKEKRIPQISPLRGLKRLLRI